LERHPVLAVEADAVPIPFSWDDRPLQARSGEVISSALIAAGVDVFGRHPKDRTAQGLFCANGQCAQCLVLADGIPVKACMTFVAPGMQVQPVDGLPPLPGDGTAATGPVVVHEVEVLVIGAGPAGLAAAAELGEAGVDVLVVDDKAVAGGKLVLQTHKFFGSREHTSAGTRGIDIATELSAAIAEQPTVELWLETTAVGVFSDRRIGVVRNGRYILIAPAAVLVATGARERQFPFPGHTLPGVYGAGAFQTLLNRDQVVSCRRVVVIGGGNVGLIAAYHALQAGIEVAGVVEAMPAVGGYRVHADKLRRLGVPIYLRHTVLAAHGVDRVEAVTIAEVGSAHAVIPESSETLATDSVLVAVGLAPLDELARQAEECGMNVHVAGDAHAIAEASAAIFSGRIAARQILATHTPDAAPVPAEWQDELVRLAAGPGPAVSAPPTPARLERYPVLRCTQEIPCNPCATVCKRGAIELVGDPLRGVPRFTGDCTGCAKCIAICPGLAITLVDRTRDPEHPIVTVPFEMDTAFVEPGAEVLACDGDGVPLGRFPVVAVQRRTWQDRTALVQIEATRATADAIAGIRVRQPDDLRPAAARPVGATPEDAVVCRCERVTAGEVRAAIRSGVRDLNEMKGMLRVCMGACGSRSCAEHIIRLFREEGVDPDDIITPTMRPLFTEVPLAVFAAGSRSP
jgi:NADPH-dependent 2,4-dienoyl-CoA reductase/sulfur reductase-like enzyme/ferredoxin